MVPTHAPASDETLWRNAGGGALVVLARTSATQLTPCAKNIRIGGQSTEPTMTDNGPFARLAAVSSSPGPDHGEERGLWERGRSGDVQRRDTDGRFDDEYVQGQAELGALPCGAIHVTNVIP